MELVPPAVTPTLAQAFIDCGLPLQPRFQHWRTHAAIRDHLESLNLHLPAPAKDSNALVNLNNEINTTTKHASAPLENFMITSANPTLKPYTPPARPPQSVNIPTPMEAQTTGQHCLGAPQPKVEV